MNSIPLVCATLLAGALAGCAHLDRHAATSRDQGAHDRNAVDLAVRLLPPDQRSYPVVVVDPDLAGDPAAVRRVDAFTIVELDGSRRRRIYVNGESAMVVEASRGNDFYVKVLAAVILHEARHIEGASEEEARRAEIEFFQELISEGLVAAVEGRQYLEILRRRDGQSR